MLTGSSSPEGPFFADTGMGVCELLWLNDILCVLDLLVGPSSRHTGVCEINALLLFLACRPPLSTFITMLRDLRAASANRLRNKRTFWSARLRYVGRNFEMRGAG